MRSAAQRDPQGRERKRQRGRRELGLGSVWVWFGFGLGRVWGRSGRGTKKTITAAGGEVPAKPNKQTKSSPSLSPPSQKFN